jgi:hypothetical protein
MIGTANAVKLVDGRGQPKAARAQRDAAERDGDITEHREKIPAIRRQLDASAADGVECGPNRLAVFGDVRGRRLTECIPSMRPR